MKPPLGSLSRERVTEIALALLGFDTTPPGETMEAVDWIEDLFGRLDCAAVRRHAHDETKPNLLATVGDEADHTLVYLGHTDTVTVDRGEWTKDPFGEKRGDRVYGRGATDMKGAVAAMLHAAETLAGSGSEPPMNAEFVFVSDEEVAGRVGLPSVLNAGFLDGDACVIGETTCEHGRHSVTVADKDSIWLTLKASGEPSYGSCPIFGENAVDGLYAAVESLRKYLGGVEFSLGSEVEEIVTESVEYYSESMFEKEARAMFESPTVNLGVFEGGKTVNAVPVSARAEVDVCLTAGVDTPNVLSRIRELVGEEQGVSVFDAVERRHVREGGQPACRVRRLRRRKNDRRKRLQKERDGWRKREELPKIRDTDGGVRSRNRHSTRRRRVHDHRRARGERRSVHAPTLRTRPETRGAVTLFRRLYDVYL